MHILKASWLQSSVTVKWSKSSKVHQHIITCLHHGKFAGAKVKISSTHDGISINTWRIFQHYTSTACNACGNVDFPTKYDHYMLRTWTLWYLTKTLKHLRASSAGIPYNQAIQKLMVSILNESPVVHLANSVVLVRVWALVTLTGII